MSDMLVSSLEHNGVKGMKWGVVHDPKSSSRAARADRFTAKAKDYESQVKAIRKGGQEDKSLVVSEQIKRLNKLRSTAVADAQRVSQGKLTSAQKTAVFGAAVVGTVVAAHLLETRFSTSSRNPLSQHPSAVLGVKLLAGAGAALAFNRIDSGSLNHTVAYKRKPELAAKMSSDEVFKKVVKGVNPNYGAVGTKSNCRRATFAYEMRRRGYDVKATRSVIGTGQNGAGFINATTPGKVRNLSDKSFAAEVTSLKGKAYSRSAIPSQTLGTRQVTSASSIYSSLKNEPVGSRGELGLKWPSGGGHSVAYEVFKDGPVVFDNQSGKQFKSASEFKDTMGNFVAEAGYSRLDNIPLNPDFVQRWVTNAN